MQNFKQPNIKYPRVYKVRKTFGLDAQWVCAYSPKCRTYWKTQLQAEKEALELKYQLSS